MQSFAVLHGEAAQGHCSGHVIGRVLCALVALALIAPSAGAQTPAGTQISSRALVSYEDPSGLQYTAESNTLVLIVAQAAGVDIEAPRSTIGDPGTTVVFSHTVTNIGNATDSVMVGATSRVGWPTRVHLDANADGALDAGDPQIVGPITLSMGEAAPLLLAVDVPGTAAVRGTVDTIAVTAMSTTDGAASDALQNVLTIRDVGIVVTLSKVVDRPSATTGDILTYTISYAVVGSGKADSLVITDPIPLGTSYVPGTMRWNAAPLTDTDGDDAGFFDVVANRVVFRPGTVFGGDSGTVTFQVRVS